jgi:hypothetical protein
MGENFDPRIDIPPGTPVFWGEFTSVKVIQLPQAPGDVNNMVIDPDQPFTIDLEWKLDGVLGNVNIQLNCIVDKSWVLEVYAEKMGPGFDKSIYSKTITNSIVPVNALPAKWSHSCHIPAGTLEKHVPGDPNQSGMYRLCIVVYAKTTIPGCHDICGCKIGPMILAEN